MNKLNQSFVLVAALLLAGNVSAGQEPIDVSGSNGERSLQRVLDNITVGENSNVDVTTDQQNSAYWGLTGSGGSFSQVVIEIAGNVGKDSFGIFDATDPSKRVELFSGPEGAGSSATLSFNQDGSVKVVKDVGGASFGPQFSSNLFGFYLESPKGLYFSDPELNPEGGVHMLAFQGRGDQTIQVGDTAESTWSTGEWILAWEDVLISQSDMDYNDFVVIVNSIEPRAVPAPLTLGLLGIGLVGFGLTTRRRRQI